MRTGTVSYKLEDLKKGVIIPIGFVGENDFTRVIFDAEEIYKKYPNASVSMKVQPPKGGIYPATVTRNGNTVIWQVKEADVANRGGGEIQLTFTDGETKIKTYIARTDVKRSLEGNGPPPDPVQDWVDNAEEVLDDLAAMDNIAKTALENDIGKALSPKTIENGVVTEWQYVEPGSGTEDYTDLDNKPSIAGVTLSGDKTLEDLGIAADDDLDNLEDEVSDVKSEIQGIDEEINGGTEYTEETWTGELDKGRYDKNGNYTASNDYRSATIDMTNVVQMKVTATDAAGVGYALVIYLNSEDTVIGSAFDCDGTRKTYTQQIVDSFPTGTAKAIVVHYRGTFDNPTIVLKKAQVTAGLKDTVESMASDVETLDGQINGTTSQETVTWAGELEKGRYDKQGNYTTTNDYRSATVDMANVLSMKVTATDAAGVGYALVVYKNAQGTVIGSAYDCDGTRKTYTEQEINTFPEGTAFAIIVHYRGTFDNPTIILTKTVETAGIAEDVDDLKDLTDGKFTMEGKKIVCFGDSIFGIKSAPNDIPTYLAKYLGATVYNCGFSGAWTADRQSQTGYNAFSLNHLIDSVVDDDYTEQENAFVLTPDLPAQYRTNLTTLEGIDFSTVDIVTIAFGTNDFMSSIPYENQNDNHDVTTVFGSLRHCIEALLTEYPNIRIFVMGQTYRFWMDGQGAFDYDSNTYERGDHTKLTDMVELTKAVAKEYNLPFIDNYKELGICQYNRTQYFPSNDGTHHNENGVILLARHIAHELF